ncbi:P-loop containing nucleoside triphosphate hydrolase protein [Dichomitus squalens]|uniref:P-loop containing nucleoside triphosphate hydrolase protein n=1 Tax=Dichomitus squalens TaxID=114155 RepID=A0A4Q9M987_9APHY|nr:P-loop containing nucleoside triphosphate hydrolase protein [Dichomitus squalens]
MRTVKLVVIGASGVGKSSIRNQYISGRFTTGYRATIGADFITKTLPHHNCPDEQVTLQIWDTAGQERFSGLSSAFFRGADAVILMFDVNQPHTLGALTKWWNDFRDKAPVSDERVEEFCCVVVGNKTDIAQGSVAEGSGSRGGGSGTVTEIEAREFIQTIVPHPTTPSSPTIDLAPPDVPFEDEDISPHLDEEFLDTDPAAPRSDSINIGSPNVGRRRTSRSSRSRSRSTLFRGGGTVGTMTTTHSIYHTPSSSLFDTFQSALSSPALTALSAPRSRSPSHSPYRSPRRMPSSSSISSVPTITPSLFIRGQAATTTATTPELGVSPSNSYVPPPPLERYPKLFFTSAKTGEGVKDVFEYIARRVVARQEYEEALEARTMHIQEANQRNSIHLSGPPPDSRLAALGGSCCGS